MTKHSCPNCGGEDVSKVIYLGLPGRLCQDCVCLTGLAAYAPPIATETEDGPQFKFMIYEGAYLGVLWRWLIGGGE